MYAWGVGRQPSIVTAFVLMFIASGQAGAAEPRGGEPPAAPVVNSTDNASAGDRPLTLADLEKAPPPPTNVVYLQYGVAVTAEVVAAPGPICDNTSVPCILGPGGGVAVRAGWRGAGPIYFGGAYELSKQDPNKLFRLAILQQARAEGRYYFDTARKAAPYAAVGTGVAGYGNEWSVATWGPAGFVGGGVEVQITRRTVVGIGVGYRLLYFNSFTDSSGAPRDSGIAQLIGLDLVLEQRDPIFTGKEE